MNSLSTKHATGGASREIVHKPTGWFYVVGLRKGKALGFGLLDVESRDRASFMAEQLNNMAHSLAYEFCTSILDGMGVMDGHGMRIVESRLEPYERESYRMAVEYLDARGLIERDVAQPHWLAVLDESEAIAAREEKGA